MTFMRNWYHILNENKFVSVDVNILSVCINCKYIITIGNLDKSIESTSYCNYLYDFEINRKLALAISISLLSVKYLVCAKCTAALLEHKR